MAFTCRKGQKAWLQDNKDCCQDYCRSQLFPGFLENDVLFISGDIWWHFCIFCHLLSISLLHAGRVWHCAKPRQLFSCGVQDSWLQLLLAISPRLSVAQWEIVVSDCYGRWWLAYIIIYCIWIFEGSLLHITYVTTIGLQMTAECKVWILLYLTAVGKTW